MTERHRTTLGKLPITAVQDVRREQFVCSCGVVKRFYLRSDAKAAERAHLDDVTANYPPVPENAQCRYPSTHDVPPWEHCDTCVSVRQDSLF